MPYKTKTTSHVLFQKITGSTGIEVIEKHKKHKHGSSTYYSGGDDKRAPRSAKETDEAMDAVLHVWEFQKRLGQLSPLKNVHQFEWSSESSSLAATLSPSRRTPRHVLRHFQSLYLNRKHIDVIDRRMLRMENLKDLLLCSNSIGQIENLPPVVKIVNLSMNDIEKMPSSRHQARPSLQALLISYNRIHSLQNIDLVFPNLIVLDVAFNCIMNLDELISSLKHLSKLAGLIAKGNPISLLKEYRLRIVLSLKALRDLDGLKVEEWERNARLSDHALKAETNVLSKWHLIIEERNYVNFKSEKHSDNESAAFRELSAALRLQHKFRMHTLRESAIIQRDILNAYQRGDLITIKIQIDRLKIVSPEVGEHANGPVQHVSIGGGKRGSKNKGSKVQEPVLPKSRDSLTIRLLLPFLSNSRLCTLTLPYMDRGTDMAFNFMQDFQFPLSVPTRDLLYQKGLEYQIWQRMEEESISSALSASSLPESGSDIPVHNFSRKVGAGAISLRPFFDPKLCRACNGQPKISQEVQVKLDLAEKGSRTFSKLDAVLSVKLQLNSPFDPNVPMDWVGKSLVPDNAIMKDM